MLYLTSSFDLFADAFFIYNGRLMFASLHGRDANLLSFQAALTTPVYQGGVDRLGFRHSQDQSYCPPFTTADRFTNLNKRVTKYMTRNFGMLTHMFLYAEDFGHLNREDQSVWLLQPDHNSDMDRIVWQYVTHLADVPLLEHWRIPVLNLLKQQNAVQYFLPGINHDAAVVGIQAAFIRLPTDFDEQISAEVRSHRLRP